MVELIETEFFKKHGFFEIRKIIAGHSGADKFYVKTDSGEELLAKVSSSLNLNAYKRKFKYMNRITKAGVPLSRFVEYEKINKVGNEKIVHFYTWCDGDTVYRLLKSGKFNAEESYNLGFKAGEILHQMHSVKTKDYPLYIHNQITERLQKSIEKYQKANYKSPIVECFIPYLESKNVDFLKTRKASYNHGDFHTSNIMYSEKAGMQIIDCSIYRGDPLTDLAYIIDAARRGVAFYDFANGQIDGYLSGMNRDSKEFKDFSSDFSFFFALKFLTLFCIFADHQNYYEEPLAKRKLAKRIKTEYVALKWFGMRFDLKEFNLSEEVLDKLSSKK